MENDREWEAGFAGEAWAVHSADRGVWTGLVSAWSVRDLAGRVWEQ